MQTLGTGSDRENSGRNRPFSVYSLTPGDKDYDIRSIIEGDLDNLPPLPSRTIRVFLSSTFSDMIPERNALMEQIYPQLKDFCRQQYRLEFQMMDLRWGIREQSHDDHTIIDFCLKEIENCKRVSLGPSFVALIGQKYGYRPFPPSINAREFEVIRDDLIARGQEVTLLDTWFKRNTNVTPAVYNLQPISSVLPHYVNKSDAHLQQDAVDEWTNIYKRLQQVLRNGVQSCFEYGRLSGTCRDQYFISVTEYEIEKGMLETDDASSSCLCFIRSITNLEQNSSQPKAQKYLDVVDGTNELDLDAQNLLSVLKNEKVFKALPDERNMEYFETTWTDLETSAPSEDQSYLTEFCNIFRDKMQWLINRSAQRLKSISCQQKLVEILQHQTMCRSRSEAFKGREEALRRVRLYMAGPAAASPLVLYGESGSGKTSVVAKVAGVILKWFELEGKESKPIVIVRFLGTTSYSCSIRLVLGGVCWQIASAYGRDMDTIPSDYPGLVAYFKDILSVATADRPLVVLLDGLDQLCPDHRAYSLAWLPTQLPPYVRVLVSTLPDRHELLDTLKTLIPDRSSFIHILPLGPQLSINLVKEWLHKAGRDLTAAQYDIVENALSTCNLPLYTSLVFQEVCRWFSYSTPDQTVLEPTVTRIINTLFDRIERYHGYVFVSHALSFLTASKNGLSDSELEDVLSLDDVVLNDVFQHWLPPLRRIPPLLLPRLQDELSSYIMQREANETVVFYWYHGQFISAARERYLSNPQHKFYIHSNLANYFLGTWGAGKKKPFKYSMKQLRWLSLKAENHADRKVSSQPLHFGPDPLNPNTLNYNLRKLSELPYHLLESNMVKDLQRQVLFNYEWLHAKLTAMSLHDVLSDFNLAIAAGIQNSDIWLLAGALRVGGNHVNQNPDTLAFDLTGRLLQYYDRTDRHQNLRTLLQQCDTQSLRHSALVPVLQCFDPPTAMLLYVLEGHSQVASDIVFSAATNELISVSKDGTLAFWDLGTGERSRAIDISVLKPGRKTRLFQSADGRYLVVDCDTMDSPVQIYETKTGQLLHTCGARLPTQSRGFLAGNLYCRQKSIIDIRTGQVIKTIDDFVNTKSYVTCAISPDARLLVIGDADETKLFDFESGNLLANYSEKNLPSVLTVTPDSRRCYAGYANDCMFRVIDVDPESVTLGRVLNQFDCFLPLDPQSPIVSYTEQRFPKELSEISVSPVNQNLVLINFRRFCLILLNVVDNSSKLMNTQSSNSQIIMSSAFTFDGRLALASAENFLHVWSTDTAAFLHSINIHSTPDFPLSVSPNRNFVATGSTIHTAIKVWDMDQAQKSAKQTTKIYESPVDCVACAPKRGLVFVKNYYGLASSNKGYKYIDSFGIDVWNLSTGTCRAFLPFNKYGKLLRMTVSADGDQMALLLNAINMWYVAVLVSSENRIRFVARHKPDYQCQSFTVSPDWWYMATCAFRESEKDVVVLWNLRKGQKVVRFKQAVSPVFTLDGLYLLYIDMGKLIICYNLRTLAPEHKIRTDAHQLQTIPVYHSLVLVTKLEPEGSPSVALWNFQANQVKPKIVLNAVAPRGILDLSKNGKLGVDGFLQVYDLQTGNFVVGFCKSPTPEEFSVVRMTYDGKYVIWVENLSVRVGRVQDGTITARTSTHERTTCLHTMDFGYVLVLGREDGHLLTMKLVDETAKKTVSKPHDSESRRNFLLDQEVCDAEVRKRLDRWFHDEQFLYVTDNDLPEAEVSLIHSLIQFANVPHAVISTTVPSTAPILDDADFLSEAMELKTLPDRSQKRRSLLSSGSQLGERALRLTTDRERRSNTPSPVWSSSARDHFSSISSLGSANGGSTASLTLPRKGMSKRSSSAQDLHRIHLKGIADVGPNTPTSTIPKSAKLNVTLDLSRMVHARNLNKEKHHNRGSRFLRNLFKSKPSANDQ